MLEEIKNKKWNWWPLFPLYPYGSKNTICKELIPNEIWSLEQIQGIYYVAVPIRMTVIKVNDGLILINPLPPTKELICQLDKLVKSYGQIKAIILPTASGLEHKIGLPALIRIFKDAEIWVCPGQWSFPINLPLTFLGIPKNRTKILDDDGFPYKNILEWHSIGPINIGLGRFQEFSCFHKPSGTLNVTDVIVGIDNNPPEIFDSDPTPLLFHSRDRGDQALIDSPENRRKGWVRLVLFASYLRPGRLKIPALNHVLKYAFKKGLRNKRSHFGIYPFLWDENWEDSTKKLIGDDKAKIQIAPVLKKLIFPRSKKLLLEWLIKIKDLKEMRYLVSAHYLSPVLFSEKDCNILLEKIRKEKWDSETEDDKFLGSIYKKLYELKVIPENTEM